MGSVTEPLAEQAINLVPTDMAVGTDILEKTLPRANVETVEETTEVEDCKMTAKEVWEACISTRTQKSNAGSLRSISRWITDTKKQEELHLYFDASGQINLQHFTDADFEDFLLEKRKTVGVSILNGFRSALKDFHFYDGKFHLLPKSFEFPRAGPFGAWKLWWFGDNHHGYPPLTRIHAHDLPSPDMHKTFSDWSVLVRHITNAALSTGLMIPTNMSKQEAVEVFRVGMDHLDLVPSTRKRRLAELSVTTILRLVREARKAKTPTFASATTSTTSTPPIRQE